jgi:O-antigen/teichoic acid export membrane protein
MTVEQVKPRHVEARRRPPLPEDGLGSSSVSEPALTDPNDITHVGALTVGAISAYAAEVARATELAGEGTATTGVPAGPKPLAKKKEGVMASSFWQLMSFMARMSGTFIAGTLIFRFGGSEAAGKFQVAQTVSLITYAIMTFGIPNMLTRTLTRDLSKAPIWIESSVFMSLAFGAILSALFIPIWHLAGGNHSTGTAAALAIGASAFDGCGRLLFSAFWAFDRMKLESAATWVQELSFLASAVVILEMHYGPNIVLAAFLVTRAVGASIAWYFACRVTHRILIPRPHGKFLLPTLRTAGPFLAGEIGSTLYVRQGQLILESFKGAGAVGLYSAGASIIFQLNILARMINNAIFPRMARAWPARPAMLCSLRDAAMRAQGVLGVPLMIGGFLVAGQLLVVLNGKDAAPAAHCMQIMALVIPVRMLSHTIGTSMTAINHQKERSATTMWAVFVNLGANLALIPKFSYEGAAYATLITEAFLFCVNAVQLRGWVGASALGEALSIPFVAAIPMALGLVATPNWPFFARVLLAALTYLPALIGIFLYQRSRKTGTAISFGKKSLKASVFGYLRAAS